MNHPRLSDAEREALQDEYSVMPAAISDEGISRQAMDRVVEMAKGYLKERDVAREALKAWLALADYSMQTFGVEPHPDEKSVIEKARKALAFRADGSEQ